MPSNRPDSVPPPRHELLDDPHLPLQQTYRALLDLRRANRYLFGYGCVRRTLLPELLPKLRTATSPLTIVDLGAGSGDIAERLRHDLERAGGVRQGVQLVEIDRKLSHLVIGRQLTGRQQQVVADALALPLAPNSCDWAISTLFFHHFDEAANRTILQEMQRVAHQGMAVIDLRRSWCARLVAGPLLRLLGIRGVAYQDGRTSVARAWSLRQVERLAQQSAGPQLTVELRRRFPFRFSLVLSSDPIGAPCETFHKVLQ